jgi:hypothetical protein
MKKLLATTALVGLVVSSASFAEIKVSGSIEQTYNSNSVGGTTAGGTGGLGQETNITVSSSKELDNGMTASAKFNLESNDNDTKNDVSEIKLSSGNFSFHVGVDTGQHMHSNINPRVDDNPFDSVSLSGDDGIIRKQAHDKQHVGVDFNTEVGKFAINYSPNGTGADAGASATQEDDASITEITFKGSLGVEGLTVLLGQEKIDALHAAGTTAGQLEEKEKVASVSYQYGQFAVGATKRTFDDGDSASATNSIDSVTALSATYSVNDNLSVGYEQLTGEFELGGASGKQDEETKAFTVGYNLGGLAVSAMWVEADNVAGSTSTASDKEGFQIRTVYKF